MIISFQLQLDFMGQSHHKKCLIKLYFKLMNLYFYNLKYLVNQYAHADARTKANPLRITPITTMINLPILVEIPQWWKWADLLLYIPFALAFQRYQAKFVSTFNPGYSIILKISIKTDFLREEISNDLCCYTVANNS